MIVERQKTFQSHFDAWQEALDWLSHFNEIADVKKAIFDYKGKVDSGFGYDEKVTVRVRADI